MLNHPRVNDFRDMLFIINNPSLENKKAIRYNDGWLNNRIKEIL